MVISEFVNSVVMNYTRTGTSEFNKVFNK